ncbi:hypothetical protein HDV01_000524 [Terramyces sp. JEL0728]|nr:hypothetical protein HDV01_000524 [Terramyces sp. JEL0728]
MTRHNFSNATELSVYYNLSRKLKNPETVDLITIYQIATEIVKTKLLISGKRNWIVSSVLNRMEVVNELEAEAEMWSGSMSGERQGLINYFLFFADYIKSSKNHENIETILNSLNLEFDQFERILAKCQRIGLFKSRSSPHNKSSCKLESEIEQYESKKFFQNLKPYPEETEAEIFNLLKIAVIKNNIVQVQLFLPFLDRNHPPHIRFLEEQFLAAAAKGQAEIIEMIVRFNKKVDPTLDKCFALRTACTKGCPRIVEFLLLDKRSNPAIQNNESIRKAATMGFADIVLMLLQDGRVDPSAKLNEALRFARLGGHVEVVGLLSRYMHVQLHNISYV